MNIQVLAYYCITPIENPQEEVARHKEFFSTRNFRGRIYISEEGINGQASGEDAHAEEYKAWMQADPRFQKMPFKVHSSHEHAFEKMTVKYRKQLVAVDCEVDFTQRGDHVSPAEWKRMLEERGEETIVLDVRNDYEWKVGHFEGSELPPLETFRQFPEYAKKLKEEKGNKTVMMYCTGGIRCEYFSAIMKKEGFEKVYQLDGGVINYGEKEKGEHWRGKLFVFDDRLVVPMNEDKTPISICKHCGTPNDVYYNCANMDCNDLFLCCPDCLNEHKGCCSDHCACQERIRPYEGNAKPFRKWKHGRSFIQN